MSSFLKSMLLINFPIRWSSTWKNIYFLKLIIWWYLDWYYSMTFIWCYYLVSDTGYIFIIKFFTFLKFQSRFKYNIDKKHNWIFPSHQKGRRYFPMYQMTWNGFQLPHLHFTFWKQTEGCKLVLFDVSQDSIALSNR